MKIQTPNLQEILHRCEAGNTVCLSSEELELLKQHWNSEAQTGCFFDVEKAAAFLNIKQSTIYAWVHQRRIPFRKLGSKLIFIRDELAEFINSQNGLSLSELAYNDFDGIYPTGSLKTQRNANDSTSDSRRKNYGN